MPDSLDTFSSDTALSSLPDLAPTLLDLTVTYGIRILGALTILVGVWLVSSLAAKAVRRVLDKTKADGTITSFAASLTRWGLVAVGVVLCMGVFGIETTSVAALLGGAGVGIAIALKGNLSNLASGMLLLAFRPFSEGDWVETGGEEGRVARVGLLHTEIDAFDNKRHWIPNAHILENVLTNHEHHAWRRVDIAVGVSYDADLEEVVEVLTGVAERLSADDAPGAPIVRATGFGASSIDFKVAAWCATEDYFPHHTTLILAIKAALDEAGIGIPFPQRDLHIKGSAPALRVVEASAAK